MHLYAHSSHFNLSFNFSAENLERAGHARKKRFLRSLRRCISCPPVSAQTDNGFFPLSRWVFCAELISDALTRHRRLLEAQIWRWVATGDPELKRRRGMPLPVREPPLPSDRVQKAGAGPPDRDSSAYGDLPWLERKD